MRDVCATRVGITENFSYPWASATMVFGPALTAMGIGTWSDARIAPRRWSGLESRGPEFAAAQTPHRFLWPGDDRMINRSWFGISIILLSGVFNGSFPLPMKYSRQWKWENTWLIFCLVSLVILPWSLATGLTPEILRVYREVPGRALCYPLAFGFLWGIAQVTFGIGIEAVGMALTFAVVMGLACLFGSLIPLLVLAPGDLLQ